MAHIRKRGAVLSAIAVSAALALSACGGAGDAAKPDDTDSDDTAVEEAGSGVITAAAAYETQNYDPSSTASALAMGTNWQVMEGLFELDMKTFEPFRALADENELVEISDTEYEVTLRDGAAFSDGTPVTAADVVESYKRATDPNNIYYSMLSFITDITEKDDSTVTVTLDKPFTMVKERLALIKIIPADMSQEDLTAFPIGSGPWKYDSITEEKVTMVPNEHYNGLYPAESEQLIVDVIKDDTARTTALQEKSALVIEAVPADARPQLESAGATVESIPGFGLAFFMFNTKKAPFDNNEVRQAFFYALDMDKLIANALGGEAEAASSYLPATHPNYNEASVVFNYDPDKARELLKGAGVDGLSVELITTDHPWIEALAPQIKNDLDAVGIDTTINSMASASVYADHADVDDATYDLILAPGDPSVFGRDPDLLMNWFYGDNVWTTKRTNWADTPEFAKLHELLDEAVGEEGEAQQDLWNQAFDILSEQVPLYPLLHRNMITGYYPEDLNDYVPISTTGLNFIGVSAN